MFSLFHIFFVLASIILVAFATPEQLEIRYDQLEVKSGSKKRYYFGSRLTFPNTKDVFTDVLNGDRGQLAAMAKDAYIAMSKTPEYLALRLREKTPYVMTALAVENKIYLATSMKGGGFLYTSYEYADNPITQALFSCGQDFYNAAHTPEADNRHKNGASCGEITAMYGYMKDTQNKGTGLKGAHVVTVRSTSPSDTPLGPADPDTIQVFDPCGWDQDPNFPDNKDNPNFVPGHFGCSQTTQKLGVDSYKINQFRPYEIGVRKGAQKKDDPILFNIGYPAIFC